MGFGDMKKLLWKMFVHAPSWVWVLALVVPVCYCVYIVRSQKDVDLEAVVFNISALEDQSKVLIREIEALKGGGEGSESKLILPAKASWVRLLLRERCGLAEERGNISVSGFGDDGFSGEAGSVIVNYYGGSFLCICLLRELKVFNGGVRNMSMSADRGEDGTMVNLTWEGIG